MLDLNSFRPFTEWKQDVHKSGNELTDFQTIWTLEVGPEKNIPLMGFAKVNIFIGAEGRYKSNESVFFRHDLQAILAYYPSENVWDSEIVIIKEFRSPTRNGFVWELPSGSSLKDLNPTEIAQQELKEETGVKIELSRFQSIESRQMVSTLSSHKANLFAVELTHEEMEKIKYGCKMFGNSDETEQTYLQVLTLKEIQNHSGFDWSMIGMIYSFFFNK